MINRNDDDDDDDCIVVSAVNLQYCVLLHNWWQIFRLFMIAYSGLHCQTHYYYPGPINVSSCHIAAESFLHAITHNQLNSLSDT